jgi:hypothetical protein
MVTDWQPVRLEMAFELSNMTQLRNGRRTKRQIIRVMFRTPGGTVFSGTRIGVALLKELDKLERADR